MDLFQLDDLIYGLEIDASAEHLEELFQVFKVDFIDNVFTLDGITVRVDTRASIEEGFEKYPHTFVKIITRGEKKERIFDRKRANKIHWIRPILENRDDEDVTSFQFLESDGVIRNYYWFKEGRFLVVMQKIAPNFAIVSCFHIDDDNNEKYYERKYENRVK